MKIKEYATIHKYPFATVAIREGINSLVDANDKTLELIEQDPTQTKELKMLNAYKEGIKHTSKITEGIVSSVSFRENEILQLSKDLKTSQLRELTFTDEHKALLPIVYQELKGGILSVDSILNDGLLKISLSLSDNGLLKNIDNSIDTRFSNETLAQIKNHKELIVFENKLIEKVRDYEVEGLKEDEAKKIASFVFNG